MKSTFRCTIWLAAILLISLGLAASTMADLDTASELEAMVEPVDVRLVAESGSCLPAVGQRLVVDVMVYDVERLNGAELYIQYDPEVLRVMDSEAAEEGIQISAGDLFAPYGRAQERTVDEENDMIVYMHQLAHHEVAGTGAMARIIFEVLQEKNTSLSFVDAGPSRPNSLVLHPDYWEYPVGTREIEATWYDQDYVAGCSVLFLPKVSGR